MDTAIPKGAQQSTMTNTGEQNSWVQCIYKMFLSTSLIGLQVLSWTSCKKVIHSIEQWNLSTADATGVLYGIPVGWFLFCWCCPWSSCKVSGSRGVGCMGGSEGRRGHCCTTICIQNWDALPVLKVVGWNTGKFKVEFDCIHKNVNQEDYQYHYLSTVGCSHHLLRRQVWFLWHSTPPSTPGLPGDQSEQGAAHPAWYDHHVHPSYRTTDSYTTTNNKSALNKAKW